MNYDEILCRRIQEVKPSGIRRFFDILEEMKDAISLGVGEPDFVTPWHIRDAGIYSLEKGFTKYTSNAGMAELRREIAAYLNRRFGLQYDFAHQIVVTVGGSEAIAIAAKVSMMILTQRICTTVSGMSVPKTAPTKQITIAAKLIVSWKSTKRWMLR